MGADLAFVNKYRPKGTANTVLARDVIGDVDGRHCVIIDDMIDTAGTICAAADILNEHGASDVWVMATHGVLSDPATDRLKNSADLAASWSPTRCPSRPRSRSTSSRCCRWPAGHGDAIDAVFEDTARSSEIFGGENQS